MTTPTTIAGLTVTVDMCRRLARAAARSLERPTIRLALPLTLVILLLVGCAPAAQITDEDFLSGARGLESFSAETDAELVAAGEGLCESLFEAGGDHAQTVLSGYYESLKEYPGEAEEFLRLAVLRYCPDMAGFAGMSG